MTFVEPLMIAFVLMVGQILLERVAQGAFAKENQLIETIILCCAPASEMPSHQNLTQNVKERASISRVGGPDRRIVWRHVDSSTPRCLAEILPLGSRM